MYVRFYFKSKSIKVLIIFSLHTFLGSSITKNLPPTHKTRLFSPFSLPHRRTVSKLRHIKIDVMHVI